MKRRRTRSRSIGLLDLVGVLAIAAVLARYGDSFLRTLALAAIVVIVIVYVFITYLQYRKMRPLNISGVDEMSGPEFEHFVAGLLRRQGYRVKEIGGFEDYGIDLIASRDQRRYAVQIKRWNNEVGLDAIRAAVAGVQYHNCTNAAVVTNHYFTMRAKDLAAANGCKLIDRDELAKQIREQPKPK